MAEIDANPDLEALSPPLPYEFDREGNLPAFA